MSYTFRKDLFVAPDGHPMSFSIRWCRSKDELQEYIEFGGGVIDDAEDPGPYTISLADENEPAETDRYFFKPAFILKSCTRNDILPLVQFRYSLSNLFPEEFDPADILFRRIQWHEVQQKYLKNNDTDDLSSSASSLTDMSLRGQSRKRLTKSTGPRDKRRSRCEFCQYERIEIVKFIVNSKTYFEVKGSAVWKRMSYLFPNHTWQSLREHFFKQVLPLIGSYNLAPEVLQAFRTGAAKQKKGKMFGRSKVRGAYSPSEDEKLLNYVKRYALAGTSLGGNKFWQNMERAKIITGRTWHSLRERYLKYLKGKEGNTSVGSRRSSTPARVKSDSDLDTTYSEEDLNKSNEVKIQKERKLISASETQESIELIESSIQNKTDNEDDVDEPNNVKIRGKRKLYTACETPKSNELLLSSPISVQTLKRPSMLEVLTQKNKIQKTIKPMKLNFLGNYSSSSKQQCVPLDDESSPLKCQSRQLDHGKSPKSSPCRAIPESSKKSSRSRPTPESSPEKSSPIKAISEFSHEKSSPTRATPDSSPKNSSPIRATPDSSPKKSLLSTAKPKFSLKKSSPTRATPDSSPEKSSPIRATPDSSPKKSLPSRATPEFSHKKSSSTRATPDSSPKKSLLMRATPEFSPKKLSPSRATPACSLNKSSPIQATPESSPEKSSCSQSTPEIILPQWPSNFTPEIIQFVGSKEDEDYVDNDDDVDAQVQRVDNGNVSTSDDSDWSEDELFWCGAKDFRTSTISSSQHHNRTVTLQSAIVEKNSSSSLLNVCSLSRTDSPTASKNAGSRKDNCSVVSQDGEGSFNFLALYTQSQQSQPILQCSDGNHMMPTSHCTQDPSQELCPQPIDDISVPVSKEKACLKIHKSTQTDLVKKTMDTSVQTEPVSGNLGTEAIRSCMKSPLKRTSFSPRKGKRVSFAWDTVTDLDSPSPKYYPVRKP